MGYGSGSANDDNPAEACGFGADLYGAASIPFYTDMSSESLNPSSEKRSCNSSSIMAS